VGKKEKEESAEIKIELAIQNLNIWEIEHHKNENI